MKIMTYNICSCHDYLEERTNNNKIIKIEGVSNVIKKYSPDIVGLNEVRDEGDNNPDFQAQARIIAKNIGYKYYYFAEAINPVGKGPYGNAIISKYPIISAENIKIPDPIEKKYNDYYESRCLIKAKIDVNGKIITVLDSHFGLNPDEHKNCVDTVIKNIENYACILMGDFNMRPDNEILAPIQKVMTDTANIEKNIIFTFPSEKPFAKIDYIFVTKDITTISAESPSETQSDHNPYICTIKL